MRGLDTETHKGLVVLIAVSDLHLELWRYRTRDQWKVLLSWLQCAGGSKAVNILPVGDEDLPRSGRGRASSNQRVVNRGGPSATRPAHSLDRGGQPGRNALQGNPAKRLTGYDLKRANCRPRSFICWNADYDCQATLKLLPAHCKEDLYRRTRTEFQDCRVRFVPSKFLWIAQGKQRIQIFDLMQFYAMSLEKASRKLLGEGKYGLKVKFSELLVTLKRGGRRAQSVLKYCRRDAELVERIYGKSKSEMAKAGLSFEKPISCASISMQRFSKAMLHTVPRYINRDFQRCFRGGRIECIRCGYFPVAYLSDIHSAYPSKMCQLWKCSGVWLPVRNVLEKGVQYAAILAVVRVPDHSVVGPSPVLGETQLIYPRGTWSQWLDLTTYRVMEEQDMIVKIKKGWQLMPDSDERPFHELEQIYEERMRNVDQNWALKIVSNASYGKLAEQIGIWCDASKITPFGSYEYTKGHFLERQKRWTHRTNFVYASAITAGIRARMYQEIPADDVIFYATDGVMTLHKPSLQVGLGLGQWSEPEEVRDLVVVGSGVYTYRVKKDGEWKTVTKLRGLDTGLDLYTLLQRKRRVLQLMVRRNWSLAQSVRQHKYVMFNELVDVPRYLDINFDRKRIWEKPHRLANELLSRSFESKPWFYYPPTSYQEFEA